MKTRKILLSVLICLVMVVTAFACVACKKETKIDLSDATQWKPAEEGEDNIYVASKDSDGNLVLDFAKNDTYNYTRFAFAVLNLDDLAKVQTLVVTAKMSTNAPYPAIMFKVEGTDSNFSGKNVEVKAKATEEFVTYEWNFDGYDITKITRLLIFADPGVNGSSGKITIKEIYLTSNELNADNDATKKPADEGVTPTPVWNEVTATNKSIGNWLDGTPNGVYTATKNADNSYTVNVQKKIGAGAYDGLISYIHGDALKNMKSFKLVVKGTAGKQILVKPFDALEKKVTLTGENQVIEMDIHTITEDAEKDFSKKDEITAENKVVIIALPGATTGTDTFKIISAEFSTDTVVEVDDTIVNEITATNHKVMEGWVEDDAGTYTVTKDGTSLKVDYTKTSEWQAVLAPVKGAEIANMKSMKFTIKGTAGKTIMLKPFNQNSLETTKTLTGGNDVFTVDIAGYVAGKTFETKENIAIIAEPGEAATGSFTIIDIEFTTDVVIDESVNEITTENHKITKGWEGLDPGTFTVTEDGTALNVAYTTDKWVKTHVKGAEIANMKTLVFTVQGPEGLELVLKPFNAIEKKVTLTGEEQEVIIDIAAYVSGKTFATKEPVLIGVGLGVNNPVQTGTFKLVNVEFSATADTSIKVNEYNGSLNLGFNNYWHDNKDSKWEASANEGVWTLAYAAGHSWAPAATRIDLGTYEMNYIVVEFKAPAGQSIKLEFAGNQIEEAGAGDEWVKVTQKLTNKVTGTVDIILYAAWDDDNAGSIQIKTATLYNVSASEVKEGNLAVTANWQPADKGDDRFSIDNAKGEIEVVKVGEWDSLIIWVDLGEGGYDNLTLTFKGTEGHNATVKLNNNLQKEFSGDDVLTGSNETVTLSATGLTGVVEIRLFLDWNNATGGIFTISNIAFTKTAA